jgi:prepilin-type N-terminal cleavage/methylation domain-containing protein
MSGHPCHRVGPRAGQTPGGRRSTRAVQDRARAPRPRPSRGLTLLELMAVLAVLAVLGTLAVPNLHAGLQRHRLVATAQQLAADLTQARFEAAQANQALHLEPRSGAGWCWSVSAVPGCDCRQAPACALQRVAGDDHPGIELLQAQAVTLLPEGAAQGQLSAPVAVLQGHRGQTLRVDLGPLGRPRVCATQGELPGVARC